jgi:hypothetical protein
VQVVNAMSDLSQGKLSRIWVRHPLQQLTTALGESLLRLPPCRMRSEYVRGAALAIQAVVDDGTLCACLPAAAGAAVRNITV